jgi:squalene synthase HpnC
MEIHESSHQSSDPGAILATAGFSADALTKAKAENFPVAARLLPPVIRRDLMAIYGFSRYVDDLGDEAPGDRTALLDAAEGELYRVYQGTASHPQFRALEPVVHRHGIPKQPFLRLLQANRQDQHCFRYASFSQLRAYCRLSADPIGELVLHVFAAVTPKRLMLSAQICTALQILEHLQDVAEDLRRDRVYLPGADLRRFGCTEADLAAATASPQLRKLLEFESTRAANLLDQGTPLVGCLIGYARVAVAGYVAGGRATLAALRQADFDVLAGSVRPTKRRTFGEWLRLLATGSG